MITPPRRAREDMDRDLTIDPPAWAAAGAPADSRDMQAALRVISYNIWFDPFCMEQRFHAAVEIMLRAEPDVICLQEVTPRVAAALRASSVLGVLFDVSKNDVAPYGCLMLVRRELGAEFSELELETDMGRTLLIAELQPQKTGHPFHWKAGVVATVHLESLNTAPTRRRQLEQAARELAR